MSANDSAGSFTMAPLSGTLDGLWEVILGVADQLPPASWALVGGQMVMAHGLAAGRTPTRASHDVDILGNLATSYHGTAHSSRRRARTRRQARST